MLAAARRTGPIADRRQGQTKELPFEDESLDVLVNGDDHSRGSTNVDAGMVGERTA